MMGESNMIDFEQTERALANDCAIFASMCDLLTVRGVDARSFLQGQLTQDLASLSPNMNIESLVLSPQGKLDGYLRVLCLNEESFALVIPEGFGVQIHDRLKRFKLRVKVEFELTEQPLVLVRGHDIANVASFAATISPEIPRVRADWPELYGVDLLMSSEELEPTTVFGDADALEVARIRAGEPKMGAELDERTIAQETSLTERCVSFTKGCFTGQELIARLDARGAKVARHLRALEVEPGSRHRVPFVGEPIIVGDKEVGAISSTAYSPTDSRSYALAYIHRSVAPPAAGKVIAKGGEEELDVRIAELA
jgi:folate-binding protein YgfZ